MVRPPCGGRPDEHAGAGANGAAWLIRDMQSGSVQRYCIWFLGGALGLTIFLLLIC